MGGGEHNSRFSFLSFIQADLVKLPDVLHLPRVAECKNTFTELCMSQENHPLTEPARCLRCFLDSAQAAAQMLTN